TPPELRHCSRKAHCRRGEPLAGTALRDVSLQLLRAQLHRLPPDNPFIAFGQRFAGDLDWLLQGDLDTFHTYSFVTRRQFGACYELAQTYLDWLGEQGVEGLDDVARELRAIAESSKAFQFQLARAMARRRRPELDVIEYMAEAWERATGSLRSRHA
ncbi:MAG: DUF1839 family protein, partial [Betaproteobacteria bacterium]|nr:DUF1839 family protein [Betaproteobacteria bacterium]